MCTPDSALHSKTLLYPRETPPRPRWRESLAVIDYGEKLGQPLDDAAQHTNVVVAIPAFNEGPTIGSVVLKARQFGSEVLVVDDGSTDDTAWIAELAGATVIRHRRNLGYGAALRSCFLYARNSRSEMMVVLDGDGQHDPSAIPRVLDPVMTGDADVSIGSRFLETKTASAVPRYRRFGIGLLTKLTNLGTKHGTRLHDAQSGFRAYSRNAIDLLDPKDADMGASAEIIWDADRSGLRIVEVPIDVRYTGHGSTTGPIRHGMSVIGSMVRYVETEHALLFFSVPGFVLVLIGLAVGLYVAESYYRTTELAVGLALITVLVMIVGMLLAFTGLILHAVINANRRGR